MSDKKSKGIELRPKQKIAWAYLTDPKYSQIRDIGYGGSAGGGKSILGSAYLIHMANKYPNTRYAACAYDITKARDSLYYSISEVLGMMGMKPDVDYTYHVNRHVFTFTATGSEIVLFGLTYKPQDPENLWLAGYLFTGAWIDESNSIDSRVIDTFTTRVGRYNNQKFIESKDMTDEEKENYPDWKIKGGYNKTIIHTKILQTFNPSQNHVYSQFWLPYKNKTQTDSRFVRAYAWDNYDKDSDYIKNLKQIKDETTKKRLLYGSFEFNTSEASMFGNEALKDMMSKDVEMPRDKKLGRDSYIVVDVADAGIGGDNDLTTIGYFDYLNCVEIEKFEYEKSDELIAKILKESRERRIPISNIVIDANGSGSYVANHSSLDGCLGFKAHYSPVKNNISNVVVSKNNKNKLVDRMESNYRTLKDQCVSLLSEKIAQREVGANIDNQLLKDYLMQELLLYEHINIGSDKPMEVTKKTTIRGKIKRSPDTSDLFIMLMYPLILDRGITKPRPLSERKFISTKTKAKTYV